MNLPSIPGFLGHQNINSLADLWSRPEGEFPDNLWPIDDLRMVCANPTDWLVVDEYYFTDEKHGGAGCVLVPPDQALDALEDTSWIGRDLGKVNIWNDGTFENGLTISDRGVEAEFFVRVRTPSGADLPVIDIGHPFLWYWDAFPVTNGWKYVNRAGREQDLIRWERNRDSWKVEVRALEFRQYLATTGRTAVKQLDYFLKVECPMFERVDAEFVNDWAHLAFFATHESSIRERFAFSGLYGQYLITGLRNSRAPRFEERRKHLEYPTFIYGLDPETGRPLTYTCDPDQLGTYFDEDGTRLHYLTPIYFRREVLQPYAAEPNRYRLSPSRLSCLDVWGIDISFNSRGLVEVHLGDLGKKLPPDEWGHWRSYNVPPEGTMDEGRFRRDFLNQWAGSRDLVGDLRRAREKAAHISVSLLGSPIWRPLTGNIGAEFDSLIGPLTDDPASLGPCLLVLTKVLVDGINPAPLKAFLGDFEKGEQSLRLLQRFTERLGDKSDVTSILRQLQNFRSRGGVAHLAGSQKDRAASDLGIAGLSNADAFDSVVARATACLATVTDLMSNAIATADESMSDSQ